ncbi:uncharacterized protein BX664DRAFT_157495 [Halteromyces radiatus]|uniref:uncharacterized protein n=1 Tax=Halteromyces radiatus TaxID=101107 RepID=UPI002220AEB3|nr:uncharacterized protein BX664DRAFT_157495 [Halteromyces radiatus]KAI8086430.1 hypothetical protein BX664DRAFT_157495 [Halteromyces radiatus]
MTEVIQAIFIRETETRQQPKPHTVYKVDVHAAVRNWKVWKRYSEFKKLHDQLCTIYPKHTPPVAFPSKSLFPSTFGDPQKTEERRRGLEDYVRGILSDRDDRWRQTEVWRNFLAIPTGRPLDMASSYTSESWLDEYQEMTQAARETRSLMNKRATHIARNEISASHNCTMQAKKLLLTLASRLASLESGLQALAQGGGVHTGQYMSEGELRRRQDMLNTLKEEKEALLKLVSTGRQDHDLLYTNNNNNNNNHHSTTSSRSSSPTVTDTTNYNTNGKGMMDRKALLGDNNNMVQRNSTGTRAFGAAFKQNQLAKETEVTRGLDNEGIVKYQQQLMEDQDQQVEQFSAILNRQKQVGYAIGDELETQNQLLDELDRDVGRTQTKLKFANKKLGKIK